MVGASCYISVLLGDRIMMSSSSSSSAAFPLDHLAPSPTEQLCYVHCNCCDTILAVRACGGAERVRAPHPHLPTHTPARFFFVCVCAARLLLVDGRGRCLLYTTYYPFPFFVLIDSAVYIGRRALQQPVQDGDGALRPLRQPTLRQPPRPPAPARRAAGQPSQLRSLLALAHIPAWPLGMYGRNPSV